MFDDRPDANHRDMMDKSLRDQGVVVLGGLGRRPGPRGDVVRAKVAFGAVCRDPNGGFPRF